MSVQPSGRGFVPLRKRPRRAPVPLLPQEDALSVGQAMGPTDTDSALHLGWTASRTVRRARLSFKSPSVCGASCTAAQTDCDPGPNPKCC